MAVMTHSNWWRTGILFGTGLCTSPRQVKLYSDKNLEGSQYHMTVTAVESVERTGST